MRPLLFHTLSIIGLATSSSLFGQLTLDFATGTTSGGAPGAVDITFNVGDDSVSMNGGGFTNTNVSSVASGTFGGSATGTFVLTITPIGLETAVSAADPANWDFTPGAGSELDYNSGWGVTSTEDAVNIAPGDAMLLSFDFSNLSIGPESLRLDMITVVDSLGNFEFWERTGATSGSQVTGNVATGNISTTTDYNISRVVNSSDEYALFADGPGQKRLSALTFSVIPEPASYGMLVGLFGLAYIALRRRR